MIKLPRHNSTLAACHWLSFSIHIQSNNAETNDKGYILRYIFYKRENSYYKVWNIYNICKTQQRIQVDIGPHIEFKAILGLFCKISPECLLANKGLVILRLCLPGGYFAVPVHNCTGLSCQLTPCSIWGITGRELGSKPVDISLITGARGFSPGLFIPRGGWTRPRVPCRSSELEGNVWQADRLCSCWAHPLGGWKGWNIDFSSRGRRQEIIRFLDEP